MKHSTRKVSETYSNKSDGETNFSQVSFECSARIIFRVVKKVSKVLFLNGAKKKMSKRMC